MENNNFIGITSKQLVSEVVKRGHITQLLNALPSAVMGQELERRGITTIKIPYDHAYKLMTTCEEHPDGEWQEGPAIIMVVE